MSLEKKIACFRSNVAFVQPSRSVICREIVVVPCEPNPVDLDEYSLDNSMRDTIGNVVGNYLNNG
jgi:hypothetical protein